MNLPADCFLAYYVHDEAWYAEPLRRAGAFPNQFPTLMVCAQSEGGGVVWEFAVTQRDLGGPCTRVEMFSDAYDALTQIPEFFTEMVADKPSTLTEVRSLLDGLGARDVTQRTRDGQR